MFRATAAALMIAAPMGALANPSPDASLDSGWDTMVSQPLDHVAFYPKPEPGTCDALLAQVILVPVTSDDDEVVTVACAGSPAPQE